MGPTPPAAAKGQIRIKTSGCVPSYGKVTVAVDGCLDAILVLGGLEQHASRLPSTVAEGEIDFFSMHRLPDSATRCTDRLDWQLPPADRRQGYPPQTPPCTTLELVAQLAYKTADLYRCRAWLSRHAPAVEVANVVKE